MVMGFEIVFFLFVVYYLVEEILEIKKVTCVFGVLVRRVPPYMPVNGRVELNSSF